MHERAKAVAENLRALILERGWNQSELARRSGMRPSNVSNYLRGTNVPNPKQLAKLAEALGATPAEILNAAGEAIAPGGSHAVCLTPVGERDGHLRLQVDQVVPAELATEVVGLLLTRLATARSERGPDVPANEPELADIEEAPAIEEAPVPTRRYGHSILDTLLPANPPKPVNAKQVRPLDGPVAVEDQPKRRVV